MPAVSDAGLARQPARSTSSRLDAHTVCHIVLPWLLDQILAQSDHSLSALSIMRPLLGPSELNVLEARLRSAIAAQQEPDPFEGHTCATDADGQPDPECHCRYWHRPARVVTGLDGALTVVVAWQGHLAQALSQALVDARDSHFSPLTLQALLDVAEMAGMRPVEVIERLDQSLLPGGVSARVTDRLIGLLVEDYLTALRLQPGQARPLLEQAMEVPDYFPLATGWLDLARALAAASQPQDARDGLAMLREHRDELTKALASQRALRPAVAVSEVTSRMRTLADLLPAGEREAARAEIDTWLVAQLVPEGGSAVPLV